MMQSSGASWRGLALLVALMIAAVNQLSAVPVASTDTDLLKAVAAAAREKHPDCVLVVAQNEADLGNGSAKTGPKQRQLDVANNTKCHNDEDDAGATCWCPRDDSTVCKSDGTSESDKAYFCEWPYLVPLKKYGDGLLLGNGEEANVYISQVSEAPKEEEESATIMIPIPAPLT